MTLQEVYNLTKQLLDTGTDPNTPIVKYDPDISPTCSKCESESYITPLNGMYLSSGYKQKHWDYFSKTQRKGMDKPTDFILVE